MHGRRIIGARAWPDGWCVTWWPAWRAAARCPFLHVAATNHRAQRVYRDLGFRERRRVHWAALEAPAPEREREPESGRGA